MNKSSYKKRIQVASKSIKADLVLKNATYLNVFTKQFLQGDIAICDEYIAGIGSYEGDTEIDCSSLTIVPGFIDAHIHIESTAVRPDTFSKIALEHGTTSIVTDPHEIANVLGTTGIDYMLEATANLPLDVFFMLPSCVPCSTFDESGAVIDSTHIKEYLPHDRVLGLAELMNTHGVLSCDEEIIDKMWHTLQQNKCIDGHGPGLSGENLMAYIGSCVGSDHECNTASEGIERIQAGQWVMIREGTASKNLVSLLPLCEEPYASRSMFCTDDRHINDMIDEGHIDAILRTAISHGVSAETAFTMASFNTASYFGLKEHGAIAPGYFADFVVLSDVGSVCIDSVYKKGRLMSEDILIASCVDRTSSTLNDMVRHTTHLPTVMASNFSLKRDAQKVMGFVPHTLLTTDEGWASDYDLSNDILKLYVVERHKNTGHIGMCFAKGYGLTSGAIATTVAHDSHNIIVIGTNDEDIAYAVNHLHSIQGGMVIVNNQQVVSELPLPIAGLMSDLNAVDATAALKHLRESAHALGVSYDFDPFMTLSFASLPVIPTLKLTTFGVVDVLNFKLL